MVYLQEVQKRFGEFCLKDISLKLPKGYIMGLIGENGAGKTSLLNVILGLYKPDSGIVKLFGREYGDGEHEIRNNIGYVLVDRDLFMSGARLIDNADMFGKYYERYEQRTVVNYCRQFSLDVQKKWKHLSKGEKLKFQFAFALSHKARLLVLDEPTANFDPEFQDEFIHCITDFVSDGESSVILATHQLQHLEQIADYVSFLHKGRMVFSADKETLIDKFRIVQGEDYKINLLKSERIIYKETGEYAVSALVRHRKIDRYDQQLKVTIPTLEEIMYYLIKSGKLNDLSGGSNDKIYIG